MENSNRNRTGYQDQYRNRDKDWQNRNQDNEDYGNDMNRNRYSDAGSSNSSYGSGQYSGGYNSNSNNDRNNDDYSRGGYGRQGRTNDMNDNYGNDNYRTGNASRYGNSDYGRGNSGNDYSDYNRGEKNNKRGDRDWWDRTSDEVSSWFGDEDAERRRRIDKMSGPHRGKGPKGYTRSDDKIRDDINDKLYHDSYVDAGDIDVTVSGGDVTLTGTVEDRETKRRAEDLAEQVTGVNNVSNNLKVNKSNSAWSPLQNQNDTSKMDTSKSTASKDISESYRRN
ncbi:MAG: BON domain-containing protein [Ginsengibacter sp.]